MEIFINNHASIPIYEQISSQIKSMIISGELTAGEALPSIRGLAKSLHISVLTVQKAYDVLQTDGLFGRTAKKDRKSFYRSYRDSESQWYKAG